MVDRKSQNAGWGPRLKRWGKYALGILNEVSLVVAITLIALLVIIIVRAIAA